MNRSEFQPVTPDDYPVFQDRWRRFPSESCERAWANLRLYRDSYDWHYRVIDDQLVTVSFLSGHVQFPWGPELPPEALAALLRRVADTGCREAGCYDVPQAYLERHPGWERCFTIEFDPGEADYLYDLEHLARLNGGRLRKKHNQIRQFERDYAERFSVAELNKAGLPEVLELARRLNRIQEPSESIDEENRALRRLEEEFDDLQLALGGVVLRVEGQLAGFSIFSPLNADTADIHFEKAVRDYHGAGAMVTYALVQTLLRKGFRNMNREQDLNDAGLRQAKRSWDPAQQYHRGNLRIK